MNLAQVIDAEMVREGRHRAHGPRLVDRAADSEPGGGRVTVAERIVAFLRGRPTPAKPWQIAHGAGVTVKHVGVTLGVLVKSGAVVRVQRGLYRAP